MTNNNILKKLTNNGIVEINQDNYTKQDFTNIIVMGIPRSGTSMTAIVLESLGVFMGTVKDDVVHEDLEMVQIVEKDNRIDKLKSLVDNRNQTYGIWGWKRPAAYRYITSFQEQFTNPHFIFMFRDPLAIAIRNNLSTGIDVLTNLKATLDEYSFIFDLIAGLKVPCLLISFEKVISNKEYFVKYLSRYFNLNAGRKQINTAIKSIMPGKKKYLLNARIK